MHATCWQQVELSCSLFRCCAHVAELEHAYFSCGQNQMSLPDLHPEAVRPIPANSTLTSDPSDLDCAEYVMMLYSFGAVICTVGCYLITTDAR